jgi:hypothetical protein
MRQMWHRLLSKGETCVTTAGCQAGHTATKQAAGRGRIGGAISTNPG